MLKTQRVAESPAVEPRSGSWRPVAAAMFVCGWGGNQFTPLLLMYRRLGGYSAISVDAFLGAYVIGLIPGLLLAGPVSDRRGRRPVLVFGTVASALASLVLSFGADGAWAIYAGRLLTGVAVGIAMSVGSSWVKELSTGADTGLAARRAALCQTAGFALGAGVAGALAQWGPWPMVTPYVVHILITAAVPALLLRVPETRTPASSAAAGSDRGLLRSLADDLRVPQAARRRFRLVVVPLAPWVFGAAGLAYAVMPQLVASHVGHWELAFATALTVLTLGTGAAVQPVAKRLHQAAGRSNGRGNARASVVAMTVMLVGAVLCALNAALGSPWLAAVAAIVLGAAYGIAVVSGLLEIQRMAGEADLAGLTGVYYALAYSGFLLPALLATLSDWLSYPVMLGGVAVVALACLTLVLRGARTTTPAVPTADERPSEERASDERASDGRTADGPAPAEASRG
ncbi:MFS transporter [Streptomyces sp. Ru73]|uniref:MFS transporter n=1 Tax=Streptomyces sp. Ru73 TaxID=2080748 RepID=UPI000CDCFAA2|nr:MFS transporter [Streptomyces sp. Ru73]POX42684.1 MFS transporter [Streptomyces sp. Ru73]